ncbi:MAG TPA: hypothetical protein PL009_02390 [Flavipsychrobacter sp.]|nr:hypothetical protein [Flavipsychrobacter sp.]
MRNLLFLVSSVLVLLACNKQDSVTKTDHYRKVIYRVSTQDSNLLINFPRAIYNENQKGNIKKDSMIYAPGVYLIPATVLNEEIELYGMSYISGNFSLQILGEGNNILAATDSIPLDPANPLHPDMWYARIKAQP